MNLTVESQATTITKRRAQRMVRRAMASGVCALAACAVLLSAGAAAGVTPTFYGYIKLDASLDSAMTDKGDYAFIVLPYATGEENDEFNMTANQTRLGVKFEAPDEERFDISGRVEFDFYGGGAENKANPMMRQAYLEMKFPAFDLLAGQTADVLAPLNPTTLNYIVLWKSGNVGYRRPQIRFTKSTAIAEGTKLTAMASLNRNMGRAEDGENMGQPSFQGRLAIGRPIIGSQAAVLGVSGLYGKEMDAGENEFESTCIAVDLSIPLGSEVTLSGEYFTGRNLGVYLGGVGQGILACTLDTLSQQRDVRDVEIEASGWWGQLSIRPSKAIEINVGAGADDPRIPDRVVIPDLPTLPPIEKNTTYYGNLIWNATPSSYVGVEYDFIETEYVGIEEDPTAYEDSRVQLSFGYRF
jgi:hypothetical protein